MEAIPISEMERNEPASSVSSADQVKQIGLVRLGSPGAVQALEKLERELNNPAAPQMDRLSAHLNSLWEKAKQHRETSGVDTELINSLLQAEGEYSPTQKQQIEDQNEPEVFEPLTGDIVANAKAWIEDMLNLPNGNIYSLDPTPLPDLPEELSEMIAQAALQKAAEWMQQTGEQPTPDQVFDFAKRLRSEVMRRVQAEADERAFAMNELMHDQCVEGEFFSALMDVINDLAIFPTAWLKGPVVYQDEDLQWTFSKEGPVPKVGAVFKPKFYAPSPFDMFPSPNCKRINQGYIFERMRLESAALASFKKVPGFNEAAIDEALSLYGSKGRVDLTAYDQIRARLEKREGMLFGFEETIEVLEFQGKLSGKLLMEWGFTKKVNETDYYPVITWSCGGKCIMARLNTNPRGDWNFSCDSFRRRSGSIWGKGIPQVVSLYQKKANGYSRAAANNAATTAGFQTILDVSRLAEGQLVTTAHAGKIWQVQSGSPGTSSSTRAPVEFFQPQPIFERLEKLIEGIKRRMDDAAGIPPYAYGSDSGRGAADTVGGLSILMNNAAKGLRSILRHMDEGIIRTSIYRLWVFNMIYHPDHHVKGDIKIVPRGALGQVVKESMFMRRQEFLVQTANEVDMQIVGIEGRRSLLEMQEETLDIPKNSIVPTADELAERLKKQFADQAPPDGAGGAVPGAASPEGGVALEPAADGSPGESPAEIGA